VYGWLGSPDGLVDHFLATQRRPASEIEDQFAGAYPPWYDVWATLGIERDQLLSPDGRRVRAIDAAPAEFADLFDLDLGALHPLDAGLAIELETRLPAWIRAIADRASMASGGEARVPMLDHEIVEFVASLPSSLRMPVLTKKHLLKQAMSTLLPAEIIRGRERGFNVPIARWLRQELRDVVGDYLSPSTVKRQGYFDPRVVADIVRLHGQRQIDYSRQIWGLLMFTMWHEHQGARR